MWFPPGISWNCFLKGLFLQKMKPVWPSIRNPHRGQKNQVRNFSAPAARPWQR